MVRIWKQTGQMPRGYLISRRTKSDRLRTVPLTHTTMTGDGSSKPQSDFVSLLKRHITSGYRRFRKLSILGKVSS